MVENSNQQSFDTLAPAFRVRINNLELPLDAKADLIEVNILEDVDAPDMATFSLMCWDGFKMKIKWIDDNLIKEGNPVEMPVESQAEADQLAKRRFEEMALRHVSGDGVCIGQPKLRAGRVIEIEGLGKRFSGSYYVTSTEHRYNRNTGYRTVFSARRNAT